MVTRWKNFVEMPPICAQYCRDPRTLPNHYRPVYIRVSTFHNWCVPSSISLPSRVSEPLKRPKVSLTHSNIACSKNRAKRATAPFDHALTWNFLYNSNISRMTPKSESQFVTSHDANCFKLRCTVSRSGSDRNVSPTKSKSGANV